MALAHEGNTNLAFDTTVLSQYGKKYGQIATELRQMSKDLDGCLADLASDGWTTPAGKLFQKLAKTNWEENIEKYANLLDTLKEIMDTAVSDYEDLVTNHIEKTKL